jgi:carbon storage regulator CsrA
MLVLSRKENETVEFPEIGVAIRVFGLTRKRVQLGIEAPTSLTVTRGEKRRPNDGSAGVPAVRQSIAEFVMQAEFGRLESELAALAELAGERDHSLAQQVAGRAADRIETLRQSLRSCLRGRGELPADGSPEAPPPADRTTPNPSQTACVRQSPAGYSVCVA